MIKTTGQKRGKTDTVRRCAKRLTVLGLKRLVRHVRQKRLQ